ncbi:hypothetical protein E1265_32255 [Streptomyces sp. 8K308]|nr:hypothetical protein E1265_32255 [Streptomyces sp. 8K308]
MLPRRLREAMSAVGMWEDPIPQPPSRHLAQISVVLEHYGWCQAADVSWPGKLCIRGAQDLLERTGHVTRVDRQLAVGYLQQALAAAGVRMAFHAWNDLPGNSLETVQIVLRSAAARAHKKGD